MKELLATTWLAGFDWLLWGLVLLFGMPVMVIVLGEAAERLQGSGYRKPLDLFRNSCLFLAFLSILLRMVVGLPDTDLAVKLADTALWISVLNATLALCNVVMFERDAEAWQSKAPKLLIDLGRILVVAVGGALIVSHVWKVDLTGLLAALGVGSLVIGLALQDTLSNVFSGVTMLSARQFTIGSWVKIGDVEGQVRSISWRSVAVATTSGDIIDIPNNQFNKDRLRVLGADRGSMAVATEIRLGYGAAPERVKAVLREAAQATAVALASPAPTVRIAAFEASAITYRIVFHVRNYTEITPSRSELLSNLWYIAGRNGLRLETSEKNEPGPVPAAMGETHDAISVHASSRETASRGLAQHLAQLGTLQRPAEALQRLAAHAKIELYRAGEALLTPGQRGVAAFIVLSGTAQAVADDGSEQRVVTTFGKGELILFKAFFRGGGPPYVVKCESDLEVVRVPLPALEAELAVDAHLARRVEHLVTARDEAELLAGARSQAGHVNGEANDGDRVQILKDLFRA